MLRLYIASETNEEAASRNRAEAKTNVVYFNDGCTVKRENLDISAAKTRRLRPQPKVRPRYCREIGSVKRRCPAKPKGTFRIVDMIISIDTGF